MTLDLSLPPSDATEVWRCRRPVVFDRTSMPSLSLIVRAAWLMADGVSVLTILLRVVGDLEVCRALLDKVEHGRRPQSL